MHRCQLTLRLPSLNFTAVKANEPLMSFNVSDPFGKLLQLKQATLQSLWELGPLSQYKFSGPAVYATPPPPLPPSFFPAEVICP